MDHSQAAGSGTIAYARDTFEPTDKDFEFYRVHGWWSSPKLFTDEEIDDALRGVAEHHSGKRERDLPLSIKKFLDWSPDSPHQLRVNDYVALENSRIGRVALDPVIGRVAARLTGATGMRLFNSSLIYKPPGVNTDAVQVGWHNDRAYWQTCTSERMLTAWIALDDVDETMGPVSFVDGSHRWHDSEQLSELRGGKSFICDDVAALERRLRAAGEDFRPVPALLRKGQVSFHHCRTFHGSGPNLGDRPRVGLIVHMQDEDNRYRHATDPNGQPYVHTLDQLVRRQPGGEPDYTDPEICPVIWRES